MRAIRIPKIHKLGIRRRNDEQRPQKVAGVWIDGQRAKFTVHRNGEVVTETLVAAAPRSSRGRSIDARSRHAQHTRPPAGVGALIERTRARLGKIDAVLVMGPGAAKRLLAKTLLATTGDERPHVEVLAAEELTEQELVERVRHHFHLHSKTSP